MTFRSTLKLDSKIFDGSARKSAGGRAAIKSAREFKVFIRRKMIESVPKGRTYRQRRGAGFTRERRSSAQGQYPAVQSGNLSNNSIIAKKTSEIDAVTEIDLNKAPYAEYLAKTRKIMPPEDIAEAEKNFVKNVTDELNKIL